MKRRYSGGFKWTSRTGLKFRTPPTRETGVLGAEENVEPSWVDPGPWSSSDPLLRRNGWSDVFFVFDCFLRTHEGLGSVSGEDS